MRRTRAGAPKRCRSIGACSLQQAPQICDRKIAYPPGQPCASACLAPLHWRRMHLARRWMAQHAWRQSWPGSLHQLPALFRPAACSSSSKRWRERVLRRMMADYTQAEMRRALADPRAAEVRLLLCSGVRLSLARSGTSQTVAGSVASCTVAHAARRERILMTVAYAHAGWCLACRLGLSGCGSYAMQGAEPDHVRVTAMAVFAHACTFCTYTQPGVMMVYTQYMPSTTDTSSTTTASSQAWCQVATAAHVPLHEPSGCSAWM